jgi:hypothetical protein
MQAFGGEDGGPAFQRTWEAAQKNAPLLEADLGDLLDGIEVESPAHPPGADGEEARPVPFVEDVLERPDAAFRRYDPEALAGGKPEVEVRRSAAAAEIEIESVGSHVSAPFFDRPAGAGRDEGGEALRIGR